MLTQEGEPSPLLVSCYPSISIIAHELLLPLLRRCGLRPHSFVLSLLGGQGLEGCRSVLPLHSLESPFPFYGGMYHASLIHKHCSTGLWGAPIELFKESGYYRANSPHLSIPLLTDRMVVRLPGSF